MRRSVLLGVLGASLLAVAATADLVSFHVITKAVIAAPAAPTAQAYIDQGKAALAAHNILVARDQFKLAVQTEPGNQEANLLYGITRVIAIVEDGQQMNTAGIDSIREIFEKAGFIFTAFSIYNMNATGPDTLASTTPRTGEVLDFLKNKALPEIDGAVANLAAVVNTNFSSIISSASLDKVSGTDIVIDYADALVVKALLQVVKCNLELLLVYGLDTYLPDIFAAPEELTTYKRLFQDATFLAPKDAARLTSAKSALIGFIDSYTLATQYLITRSGVAHHLFVIDVPLTNEAVAVDTSGLNQFKNALAEIKASLNGPYLYTFATGIEQNRFVDLSKFFDAASPINLRTKLSNCTTGGAVPDPTLGGLFPLGLNGYESALLTYGADLLGVTCTGRETPMVKISPDWLELYHYPPDFVSGPQSMVISNIGTADLSVSALNLRGRNAPNFTLTGVTCGTLPFVLTPGQGCTVSVDFATPPAYYDNNAALEVVSNDTSIPRSYVDIWGGASSPNASPASAATYNLNITRNGTGSGTVSYSGYSYDAGVWFSPTVCPGVCSSSPALGSSLTLRAFPTAGSVLAGWNGCDEVDGEVCRVRMYAAKNVTATFNRDPKPLSVLASPPGGNYLSPPTVALVASKDSVIYYTLNGATPSVASTRYTGPFTLSGPSTLKFIAVDPFGAVSSEKSETYTNNFILSGSIRKVDSSPVAGASIQVEGSSCSTQSTADGSYALSCIPTATDFVLKVSGTGYIPTYSQRMRLTSSMNGVDYRLLTTSEVPCGGSTAGKGTLIAQVGTTTLAAVAGATVTASGALHGAYPVHYFDGMGSCGGAATDASGLVVITNVDNNDTVTLSAAKSGWSFFPTLAPGRADAVTEGMVIGTNATLQSIAILGPTTVSELATAMYTATASWSDGTITPVVPTWSVTPATFAGINSSTGVMTTSSVSTNQTVTVSASFTIGGVTQNANLTVTISDVALNYAGVLHMTRSDGIQNDLIWMGLGTYAPTLGSMTARVNGPNGFSYTFTDADIHPTVGGIFEVYKLYPAETPLPQGVYTFTFDDGSGNLKHRVDTHANPHPLPIVDSSTIQFQRMANGSYRISWAPLNDTTTYYYRVRIQKSDGSGQPVFFSPSPSLMEVFSDVPAGTLADGATYQVRVEAFEGETMFNRSQSAYINFTPQTSDYDPNRIRVEYAAVTNNFSAAGTPSVVIGLLLSSLPTGTTVTVTGPNNFSYTFDQTTDRIYGNYGFIEFFKQIDVPLATGRYTFDVLANGLHHYWHATLTPAVAYPTPDVATYQTRDLGNGSIRFSWSDVDYTGALYYRVMIKDTASSVYSYIASPRSNQTFADISLTALGDLSTKIWRVDVMDSNTYDTQRNRVTGPFTTAPLQYLSSGLPDINNYVFASQNSLPGGEYSATGMRMNATTGSGSITGLRVDGPDGYTRNLLTQGQFLNGAYRRVETGEPAVGLYTFTASNSMGQSSTRYNMQPVPNRIPKVDYHTFYVDQEPSGAIRFSWAPVVSDVPIWYTIEVLRISDLSIVASTTVQQASAVFASAPLTGTLMFRVWATDAANATTINNSSQSITVGYAGPGFNYPALQDSDNDGYAANCDPNDSNPNVFPTKAALSSLSITSGPTIVNESSTANYVATVSWSDGTTSGAFLSGNAVTVTPVWSLSPTPYAAIDPVTGLLTTKDVPSNQEITVTSRMTAGSVTMTDSKVVTLVNAMSRLTLNLAGSGSGTVNSTVPTSGLILCSWPHQSGDVCSTLQTSGTFLTLSAAPSSSSVATWSGCDTVSSNSCNVNLTSDRGITASFDVKPLARIGTTYYSTLLEAYLHANNDETIEAQVATFASMPSLTKRITIKGGFNDGYSGQTGSSTVLGPLTIGTGKLTVDRLTVR